MNRKKLLLNTAVLFAICVVGAMLMTGIDRGGTQWLKFVGYLVFFASISSSAIFSSRYSCSAMLRRLRKQS